MKSPENVGRCVPSCSLLRDGKFQLKRKLRSPCSSGYVELRSKRKIVQPSFHGAADFFGCNADGQQSVFRSLPSAGPICTPDSYVPEDLANFAIKSYNKSLGCSADGQQSVFRNLPSAGPISTPDSYVPEDLANFAIESYNKSLGCNADGSVFGSLPSAGPICTPDSYVLEDLANFAIESYNKSMGKVEFEFEQFEEWDCIHTDFTKEYGMVFTAKDDRADRRETFEAVVLVSKSQPAAEAKILYSCKMQTKAVKLEVSIESKIQQAAAAARNYHPTVVHDNPVVVECRPPTCPIITKRVTKSPQEIISDIKRIADEKLGYCADVDPIYLRSFGCGRSLYPDEIRAMREKNYMDLAKTAIASYNTAMKTEFELEEVCNAALKSNDYTSWFVYNLDFTARDDKSTGLEDFEAVVRVDFSVRDSEGSVKKVELCKIKST